MKKTYINPSMEVIQMDTVGLLANSFGTDPNSSKMGGVNASQSANASSALSNGWEKSAWE